MRFVILIPTYGSTGTKTIGSARSQKYSNKEVIILQDDPEHPHVSEMGVANFRNKERKYALRNIVEFATKYSNSVSNPAQVVFGVLDGDDYLTREDALDLIIDIYKRESCEVLWTNYTSDTKEAEGFSRFVPPGVNIYNFPWSSSHFKTFRGDLLLKVPEANFKGPDGEWVKRCYDQYLMKSLLYKANGNHYFLNEICYHYTTNKNTFDTIQLQHELEIYLNNRGFVS